MARSGQRQPVEEYFTTDILPLEFGFEFVRITFCTENGAVVSVVTTPAAFNRLARKIGNCADRSVH